MINLILCGGGGTRLWPLSRRHFPKQFTKILSGKSLFQKTVQRNLPLSSELFIVTSQEQYFIAKDQLHELSTDQSRTTFLLEPIGRNTAPAIALACFNLPGEAIVFTTPSDHEIENTEQYIQAVNRAKELASQGHLVTFGISPTYPETGYGYIIADGENVDGFKEKPDRATAQQYIQSGASYWNSGMFCFTAQSYLQELKQHSPDIYDAALRAHHNIRKDTEHCLRIQKEFMLDIPSNSIDYAVMEKSTHVRLVPCSFKWSDMGSFDALDTTQPKDDYGNTISSKFVHINSKNNLVLSSQRLIAGVDIQDLVIVDTPDALLVTKKQSTQKVRDLVDLISSQADPRHLELLEYHTTVKRPWGEYFVIAEFSTCKVKRITVKPGKRLSLQKHQYRSEHWIIISGTGEVTIDDRNQIYGEDSHIFIRQGAVHRVANTGASHLIFIEIQTGSYLGEDDIVRLEDDFGRAPKSGTN
ncbi:mannose-1-phosphate guanylyltransferase/mannose-6-phosphate isomerase [Desulfurispirillum indicum S5]|uniref:mannose-1-phosphate guanylyltransferase n=1 Tax=Desulfurispirillum indicum (strain ATCC BAA-1389 / DSM 22839 / S5) TaxID=653733 RepID=E6W626_DESIS|nr:mannose-1-phosphate guanylyltransferase/mannose-6-phosphate isomerase [Desulfurispirillum indicum]ADU64965.1 mannose-1-phosphate guanylyltransferase/mannose-6-phosphate isomerase [Desulfurispirillum indicum S5]